MTIRDLTADEMPTILPLIEAHYASTPAGVLRERLMAMIARDYHCIAAYLNDELVGVAGYWVGTKFWCGRYLEPDNVVVHPYHRGSQIGSQMMDWLEAHAKTLGCEAVMLDSYVTLFRAHKFYMQRDYHIAGYHFLRRVSSP